MNSGHSISRKIIIFFAFLFFLLNSCSSSVQEGNDYLQRFDDEVFAIVNQPEKIKVLKTRELEKYKNTGDRLYLISSEYCGLFTNHYNFPNTEEIFLVFKLLNLNNDQYDFITIACNFNLAYQFANISPVQSMEFLDKAIELDEKTGKMYALPHMFHLKGKLYYDKKEYNNALLYYNKALESYIKRGKKDDTIYIASMYSNSSMVYKEMNNIDLAIENLQKGIDILKRKKNLNLEEKYYIQFFSGTLATYFMEKKDYPAAEKLLIAELEFCKKVDYHDDAVVSSQRLINIYTITGEKNKYHAVINFLIDLEPRIKRQSLRYKIVTNELLRDYYAEINDLPNLKLVSKNLTVLENQQETDSKEELQKASDSLYKYVLKKTQEEYDHKIAGNKRRIWFLLSLILFIILFSIWIVRSLRSNNKREKELIEKQKIILENNKTILEQDIQLHKEKIKNLNLNLNLKIETEKAFLENLKKIRRSKNIDIEQTIKDLFFKINNLIEIDKKNFDFVNESSMENKLFMEKLSKQFPSLTKQELKLCVYFKLNLSSKEVSLLDGITSGSVRVYKTKIKSKIGLDKETDLNTFLNNI